MKALKPIKELSFASLAILAVSGSVYAVEPLTDEEMGKAIVIDPFGATAAGGQIDTTLAGREDSATSADETNQALATDPNLNPSENYSPIPELGLSDSQTEHRTTIFGDGIKIQTQGNVQTIHIDALVDNTGANRGSQTYEGLRINNTTIIREYR
ncbi:hypothetical protein [Litoribrevibacter albus]|uniref:Uncharacterized protein n=1 Tax=Litoribrevibacter albus TaxID=1473156 RepID=A0AA37W7D8_9GAMM|nr:hypothetical protein [Litoribrevibacter albus]GLQ32515.1 hypothetical protein GCM10007876_29940 [Litoribrevibacter albus]